MEFSELINNYIIRTAISEQKLADISGFSRSYIAGMRNGKMPSSNLVNMEKLFEELHLSPKEAEELWHRYKKARLGNKVYERYQIIFKIIENFRQIPTLHIDTYYKHQIPHKALLYKKTDVHNLVQLLLENEFTKENGIVRIVAQHEPRFLIDTLARLSKFNNQIFIEHILCLESSQTKHNHANTYNLNCVKSLIPIIISGGNYNPLYYYDHVQIEKNPSTLMPYLILTSNYVVTISHEWEQALIIKDSDYYNFYNQIYEKKRRNCKNLMTKVKKLEQYFDFWNYQYKNRTLKSVLYSLNSEPCLVPFFSEKILANCLENTDDVVKKMVNHFFESSVKEDSEISNKKVTYFTREGLDNFVNSGRISECPYDFYEALNVEERLEVLKAFMKSIQMEEEKSYLIKTQKLKMPLNVMMSGFSGKEIAFVFYLLNQENVLFTLNERTCSSSIYEFLKHLENGDYLYSEEETLSALEEVVKGLEEINTAGAEAVPVLK